MTEEYEGKPWRNPPRISPLANLTGLTVLGWTAGTGEALSGFEEGWRSVGAAYDGVYWTTPSFKNPAASIRLYRLPAEGGSLELWLGITSPTSTKKNGY